MNTVNRKIDESKPAWHRVKLAKLPPSVPLTADEVADVLNAYRPGEPIKLSLPACVNLAKRDAAGLSVVAGKTRPRKSPCGNGDDDCRPCAWRPTLERGLKVWRFVLDQCPNDAVHVLRLPDDKRPYDALRKWAHRGGHWFQGLLQGNGSWLYVLSATWSCVEHDVASERCRLTSDTTLAAIVTTMILGSDSAKSRPGEKRRRIRGTTRTPERERGNPFGVFVAWNARHRERLLADAGIPYSTDPKTGEPMADPAALVRQGSDWLRAYGLKTSSLPQEWVDQLVTQGEDPVYARLGPLGRVLRALVKRHVSLNPSSFRRDPPPATSSVPSP